MELRDSKHLPSELTSQLITIMTTEHYTLQMGRANTMTEINGRTSLFVGAVSSGVLALAFIGQTSHLGAAFVVFGLVVLPTLVIMGLVTFRRVLQASNADMMYARGINRIRHLYLEYAPQMQPYFILSTHDDAGGTVHDIGVTPLSWWQGFFSSAGMIAMITSALAGSFTGLLLVTFSRSLAVTTSGGIITFLLSVGLHLRYQMRQWTLLERDLPARFPSQSQN